MKKILITGGAGYVGSVLRQNLSSDEYDVISIDNGLVHEQIDSDKIIKGSITDADILNRVKDTSGPFDAVIHLAAVVGDPHCDMDQQQTIETNIIGTALVSQVFGESSHLVFASTCSVYGFHQNDIPLLEDDPVNPISLYGRTKVQGEKLIKSNCSSYTILRFGTLFGYSPKMRFDLVANLFMGQAMEGETIKVYGGGVQIRPFCHVKDAALACKYAADNELEGIYNVVWDNLTIKELAEKICELSGASMRDIEDKEDDRNYAAHYEKLQDAGFKPALSLTDFYENVEDGTYDSEIKNYTLDKYYNHKIG